MTELWDRRIPPAEDCVLAALLERRARETPDKVFVVFEDDETWTYAQTLRPCPAGGARPAAARRAAGRYRPELAAERAANA